MKKGWILLSVFLLPVIGLNAAIRCVIRGELSGLQTDEVLFVKATLDQRHHGDYVAVKDGCFEYTLSTEYPEAYKLIFVTSSPRKWYTFVFFPEEGELQFSIDSTGSYTVSGSTLSTLYQQFSVGEKAGFAAYGCALRDSVTQGKCTPSVKRRLMGLLSDMSKQKESYVREYFAGQRNEVFYYLVIEELQQTKFNRRELSEELLADYQQMAALYPSHPYTALGKLLADGLNSVRPGGRYIEFVAPDLEGNPVNITDRIRGKIALIDLWASWCMPCRAKARAMIPVYEKYKDKGFEVVGVAREFKNTDKMREAIAKDKYPWLQLVELDDSNRIWTRYMLGNAGGGVFLVNRDGTILLVNPTLEEIQSELIKWLGE